MIPQVPTGEISVYLYCSWPPEILIGSGKDDKRSFAMEARYIEANKRDKCL